MPSPRLLTDLSAMLTDAVFASTVVCGGVTTTGHFDRDDTSVLDESGKQVFIRNRTIRIRTGTLPALARGVAITVDGTAYVVHDANAEGDGNLTLVTLA